MMNQIFNLEKWHWTLVKKIILGQDLFLKSKFIWQHLTGCQKNLHFNQQGNIVFMKKVIRALGARKKGLNFDEEPYSRVSNKRTEDNKHAGWIFFLK